MQPKVKQISLLRRELLKNLLFRGQILHQLEINNSFIQLHTFGLDEYI